MNRYIVRTRNGMEQDFASFKSIAEALNYAFERFLAHQDDLQSVGIRVVDVQEQKLIAGLSLIPNGLDIRCCTECGCSEDDPCEGGCSWVGARLCSECEMGAAA